VSERGADDVSGVLPPGVDASVRDQHCERSDQDHIVGQGAANPRL